MGKICWALILFGFQCVNKICMLTQTSCVVRKGKQHLWDVRGITKCIPEPHSKLPSVPKEGNTSMASSLMRFMLNSARLWDADDAIVIMHAVVDVGWGTWIMMQICSNPFLLSFSTSL